MSLLLLGHQMQRFIQVNNITAAQPEGHLVEAARYHENDAVTVLVAGVKSEAGGQTEGQGARVAHEPRVAVDGARGDLHLLLVD